MKKIIYYTYWDKSEPHWTAMINKLNKRIDKPSGSAIAIFHETVWFTIPVKGKENERNFIGTYSTNDKISSGLIQLIEEAGLIVANKPYESYMDKLKGAMELKSYTLKELL